MVKSDEEVLREKEKLLKPGSGFSWHEFTEPDFRILNTFKNPLTGSSFQITFFTDELTAFCPLTGFPDQYSVSITYVPKEWCVESKSAKFYFGSYRSTGAFIEQIAERIFNDWTQACSPVNLSVQIEMKPRGGVKINVKKGWSF